MVLGLDNRRKRGNLKVKYRRNTRELRSDLERNGKRNKMHQHAPDTQVER